MSDFSLIIEANQLLQQSMAHKVWLDPVITVMCLRIGTPKIINLSFIPNVKLFIFRCPKIWAHYSLIIICLNIGTPKTINFPFGPNGKLKVLGVSILKHFRVGLFSSSLVNLLPVWRPMKDGEKLNWPLTRCFLKTNKSWIDYRALAKIDLFADIDGLCDSDGK